MDLAGLREDSSIQMIRMYRQLQNLLRRRSSKPIAGAGDQLQVAAPPEELRAVAPLTIERDDPLLAYLQNSPGIVRVDELDLASPALAELKAAGIQLAIPLVNQGQLIGVLNVGARLSEQEYSSEDRRLLANLASQAAPAMRVAQMVQQQRLEALQRERIDQELRVARIIQETLLPKQLPDLPGWSISAYWRPAQAVGGDFYDFIGLPDGKLGIVIADVTDKGVPAALVMASTRSILRGAAEQSSLPGQVLARVNNLLYPDMPPKMFVTCLYAIFTPATGHFWFANAGHNLPSQSTQQGVVELWARGMPLGLMPDMQYEEAETTLAPGESVLLYSDGLIEAHNAQREMFGFPRLHNLLAALTADSRPIEDLKTALADFVGPTWTQEDDVTMVLIERQPQTVLPAAENEQAEFTNEDYSPARVIASFTLASQAGNERSAMEQVAAVVEAEFDLPKATLNRLKTAVAEAVMNAMEHGNHFDPDRSVKIVVRCTRKTLTIAVTDQGRGRPIPEVTAPDLTAKLAGKESPRGWGLFLIRSMVDDLKVLDDDQHHTLELIFDLT